MRHIRFTHRAALLGASLAAVAIIASACGSQTATTDPPASDPTPSPTASETPSVPPKAIPTQPQTGDLAPTIPIDSVRLSADGKKLTVSYYIGPAACHGTLDKAEVEQSASGVSVRLLRKAPAKQNETIACVEIVELKTTEVVLDTPLGSRPVTDAGTDQPIKVTA